MTTKFYIFCFTDLLNGTSFSSTRLVLLGKCDDKKIVTDICYCLFSLFCLSTNIYMLTSMIINCENIFFGYYPIICNIQPDVSY